MHCVPSVASEGDSGVVCMFVRESLDAGELREELAEVARDITRGGPVGGTRLGHGFHVARRTGKIRHSATRDAEGATADTWR